MALTPADFLEPTKEEAERLRYWLQRVKLAHFNDEPLVVTQAEYREIHMLSEAEAGRWERATLVFPDIPRASPVTWGTPVVVVRR